jgi:hypothetical protein
MRKETSRHPENKGGAHHPKGRGHEKAWAMREAVRKAIESLIEKKGPEKGHFQRFP